MMLFGFLTILIAFNFIAVITNVTNYECFGSGLINDLTLPYKEIYIQCKYNDSKQIDDCYQNLKINLLDIKVNKPLKYQKQFLNETLLRISYVDDSYSKEEINLFFEVLLQQKHVCNSPYEIRVKGEYAKTLMENKKYWESINNCSNDMKQIKQDFSPFDVIDFENLQQTIDTFDVKSRSQSVCLYKIVNNQLYGKCYGQYVDFRSFIESFLHSLLQKVKIDDIEFLFNLGDYPLSMKSYVLGRNEKKMAIFSWCGSKNSYDIVLPTYEMTQSIFSTRTKLKYLDFKTTTIHFKPFNQRYDVAFFRGRDSRKSRLNLASLSNSYPKLIDAKITNFFFFPTNLSLKGDYREFNKFFEYKYIINMDGTVAAYRLPFLLDGGSVILKHPSNYYEYFYDAFKDGENVVFFNENLTDLVNKIKWLRENPIKVMQIINKQLEISIKYLSLSSIYCYYYQAFSMYKSKMNWDPKSKNLIHKDEYKLIKDPARQSEESSFHSNEL